MESFFALLSFKMVFYMTVVAALLIRNSVWKSKAKRFEALYSDKLADWLSSEDQLGRYRAKYQAIQEECDCANKKIRAAVAEAVALRAAAENRAAAILLGTDNPPNPIDLMRGGQ